VHRLPKLKEHRRTRAEGKTVTVENSVIDFIIKVLGFFFLLATLRTKPVARVA